MASTMADQGIVARTVAAVRYALTGAMPNGWFGPLTPLPPQAPEGTPPRQWDYPVGVNINYRPRASEPTSFEVLKKLATHPLVAMLINNQRDKCTAMTWSIKSRKKEHVDKHDASIQAVEDFLTYPDQEHDWGQWLGAILEQLMVIDAVTVYPAPTRAGDLYALQILDGAQFTPIIDLGGRRPLPPEAAYQQIIKGLPAIDYSSDELIYFPQVWRADKRFGYSRVEQAKDLIETAISRLRSQKGYFDFGNTGDGYFTAPETWTPAMVKNLEAQWNSMMEGDPGVRRNAPFLPHGAEWHATKTDLLADAFDEYLIRQLCFPFGVAPQPFMKQAGLGHGSSETEHEAAEEAGIASLMEYVVRLMNLILAKCFNRPDLEFVFADDREFDPTTASEIDDRRLKNGSRTINEVRDANGEEPIEGGDVAMIYLTSGPVLVSAAANPPEPVIVDPAAALPAADPKDPAKTSTAPKKAPDPKADVVDSKVTAGGDMTKSADPAAEKRLAIVVASYLKKKGEEYADAIEGMKLLKAAGEIQDPSQQADDAINQLEWDWSDFPELVQPILAGVAVTAGADAVSQLGLFSTSTLERVSAKATEYAADRGAELVGMKWVDGELVENPNEAWSILQTTRNTLRTLVTNAMEAGDSNDMLKGEILDSTVFSSARASMVARTETAMADVQGTIEGWKASDGIVSGKQFVAAPDCCDECQAQDGEIVGLDEEFSEGDPPVHPNCRCNVVAVLADESGNETEGEDLGDGGEE